MNVYKVVLRKKKKNRLLHYILLSEAVDEVAFYYACQILQKKQKTKKKNKNKNKSSLDKYFTYLDLDLYRPTDLNKYVAEIKHTQRTY